MSKVNRMPYMWNPYEAAEALGPEAPAHALLVYRLLCDKLWLAGAGATITSPAGDVRRALCLDAGEYKRCVEALIGARMVERDHDAKGALVWRIPMIEKEQDRLKRSDALAQKRAELRLVKESQHQRRTSLRRRVGGPPPTTEPKIIYLRTDQRKPFGFMGWLPSSGFDNNGQALLLSDEDVNEIISKHPGKDVPKSLSELFRHLIDNPGSRVPLARLPSQIERWVGEGFTAHQRGARVNLDTLDGALEQLPELGATAP